MKNKLIELGGTVDKRELYRAMNLDKQTFMKALNQLLDTRQVVLTQRKNIKGRNVDVVSIPKKMQNGYDSMTVMTVCEINTTETQTKPKNASHCHKPHCHNAYDSVATQPTVPEPPLPRVPAAKPETTIAAKPVVNPEKTEAKPMPAPAPEPEHESTFVEPGTPLNAPPEANVEDLAGLVLSHLEKFWSCRKIPGDELRRIIATICPRQADAVWKLLFPAHVVKLHTTDFFILREHERRPKGYDGLIDDAGILPCDEPAPF
jgi:hypothetical protein